MESKRTAEQAEQIASRFIAQRETGPWTGNDAAELQQWLAQSTLHRVAYYRLNAAWQEAGRLVALGAAAAIPVQHFKPSFTLRRSIAPFAVAAGVVITVGAGLFLFREHLFHPNRYSTVIGGLEAVPLSDGSRITLNTDSTLRVSLGKEQRRIDLDKGEAFFEVAKDAGRPFIVHAGDKRIVAVGTQFSVRREGPDIEVRVTEGLVRVESAHVDKDDSTGNDASDKQSVLLPAGTFARSVRGAVLVQSSVVADIEQYLSWRSGILTFHDTPLRDAVAELNRYNSRKIVIQDPEVADLQVGGVFGATTIDPFVRLLESGFPIRVSEEGDRIILSAR